jgi:hypothetical protein
LGRTIGCLGELVAHEGVRPNHLRVRVEPFRTLEVRPNAG